MRIYFLALIATIIFVSSCNNSNDESNVDPTLVAKTDAENITKADSLAQRYRAVSGWDTTGEFSFHIQEILSDTTKTIRFDGDVDDIIKVDEDNYLLKIHDRKEDDNEDVTTFLAYVDMDRTQADSIDAVLGQDNVTKSGSFILKVNTVKVIAPEVFADPNNQSDDDLNPYFDFNFAHKVILIKANLLDFTLSKDLTQ